MYCKAANYWNIDKTGTHKENSARRSKSNSAVNRFKHQQRVTKQLDKCCAEMFGGGWYCLFAFIKMCGSKCEWTHNRKVRLMGWNVYCKRRCLFSFQHFISSSLHDAASILLLSTIVLTQRNWSIFSQLFVWILPILESIRKKSAHTPNNYTWCVVCMCVGMKKRENNTSNNDLPLICSNILLILFVLFRFYCSWTLILSLCVFFFSIRAFNHIFRT